MPRNLAGATMHIANKVNCNCHPQVDGKNSHVLDQIISATVHILTVDIFYQLILLFKRSTFMQLLMWSDISTIFSKQ